MEIVAVDLGGTHVRFARAEADAGAIRLGPAETLKVADFPSLAAAWRTAAAGASDWPRAAAIAVACPIHGETLKLTNNPWVIRPASLAAELGCDDVLLVNDFGAMAHAAARLGLEGFRRVCGPERGRPESGVVSIVGPGTGLGVGQLLMLGAGRYRVIETEGGHAGFAPTDALEDALVARLRARHGRVSAERVVSGQGLVEIHAALGGAPAADATALWTAALEGRDETAQRALAHFCAAFGGVAGDAALAQGAQAVVLAGGLTRRLADRLAGLGFERRFVAKGRFEPLMRDIPVLAFEHPEPGLFGAAAAWAARG